MKSVAESLLFDVPVMDLAFSKDNKFLTLFYKNCKVVLFSVEKGYQPVKTIEYEFPNDNYFSLAFHPESTLLANISSNANTITIWETRNFSLKHRLDLTGEIIRKIQFAPNSRDFVVLTTSSKLLFYRLGKDLTFIKDAYGVNDLECLDFEISANNQFILTVGKDGIVKIYDYFMRGEVVPSCQGFLGHFQQSIRGVFQDDMRHVFTIGDGNGIFKWRFQG